MKKILFIAVVLLLVSTISFGQDSYYGRSRGGTQTQIASTSVSQSSSACGSCTSFSQYGAGSAYATQQMYTRQGAMSQAANPTVQGGGSGTTGWFGGFVASFWSGLSSIWQGQSL